MSRATRTAVYAALAVVLLFAAIAGSYALSLRALNQSQHKWCDSLTLLTADAHPTTENGQVFYDKLRALERQFGC
jgi:hypothetical protein